MKYSKSFDIWQSSPESLREVQAGQWVYAGNPENKGRFLGVKPSGSIVVAWQGNAKRSGGIRGYYRALRDYAKGINRAY